ncbi:MAG: hypothetical protein AAGC46_03810 [Solirubrobacteraceae bacterium]|nr:hypothetical protein [Patulibacter sp.]
MRNRLLLAAVAAASLVVPTSALAGTRGMTIKLPKSITEGTRFSASYTGDTGPGDQALGGFIIYANLYSGGGSCPADPATGAGKGQSTTQIAGGNLFGAGAFSAGDQVTTYDHGKYRVCGYITQNANSHAYDLVYSKKITVKARKRFKVSKIAKIKDGVYSAATATTTGGNPDASVTFTVQGGHVISGSATGIPTVSCYAGFATQTPVAPAVTSASTLLPNGNPVYSTLHAAFNAPPNDQFYIDGGATSTKTILGTVSGTSSDSSCTGSFAFTATRQK